MAGFTASASAALTTQERANRAQLCKVWYESASNPEVEVAGGLKVSGSRLQRIGDSCIAPGAEVRITDAQVEKIQGSAGGTAAAQILAAVTHAAEDEAITEGSELFNSASISRMYVGFDLATGLYVGGELRLAWSGGTNTYFAFKGTISGLDAFDFELSSPEGGTVIPNVGGVPLDFAGTLKFRGGRYTLDVSAQAPSLTVGEGDQKIVVTDGDLNLHLKDEGEGQRLAATVKGKIAYGPNVTVDGSVDVDFDDQGPSKVRGGGKVTVGVPATASSPAGTVSGSAVLAFDRGQPPLITFEGEARFGEAVILGAKGTVDLAAVNFTGDATVKNNDIVFTGAVEGIVYIGTDLQGRTITNRAGNQVQAKTSEWLVKSATASITAKGVVAKGVAQVGDVGGERWIKGSGSVNATFTPAGAAETVLKGTAGVEWVEGRQPRVEFAGSIESGSTFVANAAGSVDGHRFDFSGELRLNNPDLKIEGNVFGYLYYGDPEAGSTVRTLANTDVAAKKGDLYVKAAKASVTTKGFTLAGAMSVGRVGDVRWARGTGSVDTVYNGTKLAGSATLNWSSPNVPSITFKGSASNGDVTIASAEGTADGSKLAVKGTAKLKVAGFTVDSAAEGTLYYGTDLAGQKITSRSGAEVQAKQGDFHVKANASSVVAQGFTVKGIAQLGRTDGAIWAKATGEIDAKYGETALKGSVTAEWSPGAPVAVTFSGSVANGTTVIGDATGTFDGKKLVVKGTASFNDPKFALTGNVEGVVYYGDDLAGETVANRAGQQVAAKKGDFLVKSNASGTVAIQDLKLTGVVSLASVSGDLWVTGGGTVDVTVAGTKVKGSATLAWTPAAGPSVAFEGAVSAGDTEFGKVKGAIDGAKITFTGEAKLTNALLSASGTVTEGVVYYGSNLQGQTVTDRAGKQVAAKQGDVFAKLGATAQLNTQNLKLTGAAQLGSTGGEKWVTGGGAVDLSIGDVAVKGSAAVEWIVGKAPAVTFEGTVSQGGVKVAGVKGTLDDKKLTFTGEASLVAGGYTTNGSATGVVYFGDDLTGEKVKNRAGDEIPATKGDVVIESAKAQITAKGLTLVGDATISYVGGKLFAEGQGAVDFTTGETNVKGSANATWALGEQPVVAFGGTVTHGTTAVGNVIGQLDGKKLTVRGDAKITDPKFTVEGAVEGVVYYGDDLAGETVTNKAGDAVQAKKGDYVLSDASTKITAKGLELTGKLTLANVGGQVWATAGGTVDLTYGTTNVKGTATLEWTPGVDPVVSFAGALKLDGVEVGSVTGTVDGSKISFNGKASYKNATVAIDGNASGVVYYGSNLSAEKVKNKAGVEVTPSRGDFVVNGDASAKVAAYGVTLGGKVTISGVGTDKWVAAGGTLDVVYGAYTVKGSATLDWTIGTPFPAIPFTGTLKSADVEVASVKGTITDKVVEFTGTAGISNAQLALTGAVQGKLHWAADQTGQKVKSYAGAEVQAKQYDLFIKSASAKVDAKGFTLTGDVEVGILSSEKWVKGGGSVDATFGSTKLKGAATVDYPFGGTAKVTFTGSLSNGSTVVGNASGSADGKKIAVKGDVALTDPSFSLKGAAEGVVYYGDTLTGETVKNRAGAPVPATKGDFVLTSASGEVVAKSLTLKGAASFSSIGSEKWATGNGEVNFTQGDLTLKGKAAASWVVGQSPVVDFEGSVRSGDVEIAGAKGTLDGKKIVFAASAQGNATIANQSLALKGAVTGTVYYGADQSGETVKNKAGVAVPAKQGDFLIDSASATVTVKGLTLVGKATVGNVGGQTWVTAGGTVDITAGGTNVKGSATADWVLGKEPVVTYEGEVSQNGLKLAAVRGTIDRTKLTFEAAAQLSAQGIGFKGQAQGVVYLGDDLSGEKIRNASGALVAPARGDVFIEAAVAEVTAKGVTAVGAAQAGFVTGKLWVEGSGSIDATFGTTKLTGTAGVTWAQGAAPTVAFSGTITNGTTAVANAAGLLDGKTISVKGDAQLTDPRFTLKGAVEGTLYYGDDLAGEVITDRTGKEVQPAKGDFVISGASAEVTAKNLTLKGTASFTSLGATKWATASGSVDFSAAGYTLKGTADIDWLVGGQPTVKFKGSFKSGDTEIGSASGELDGKKISLSGQAKVAAANLTLEGSASGVVHYAADQTGETIKNKAGASVAAKQGDFLVTSATAKVTSKGFVLTGNASAGRVGTQAWVTGGGSVDVTYGTVNVKGSATVDWIVGGAPSLAFEGTLKNNDVQIGSVKGTIDDKKITFGGAAKITTADLSVSGTVTGGVLYYADVLTGEQVKNKAGALVQATKGDLRIESASADVVVRNLAFKANVQIGIVGSAKWVKGTGSVDATFGSTKLSGSADFDWNVGSVPTVAFTGGLSNGTAVVANAAGTLDGKKIAIKGNVKATTSTITVTGAVEGVFFYGQDQTGELVANRAGTKVQPLTGDYLLTNASGTVDAKGLSLAGGISVGNVRGDWWATAGGSIDLSFGQPVTRIQGSASMKADGNVTFEGKLTNADTTVNVSGTADGKKITFTGDLSNPVLSGKASGYVYYGENLAGETVVNRAGKTVPATRGDFKVDVADGSLVLKQLTVAGAQASLVKAGTDLWVKGGGKIKIAQTWIDFTGEADSSGYANLTGSGTVNFDGTIVDFSGTATIKNNALTISGSAKVSNGLLSATLTGTITKPDMNVSQYTFVGTANFKFGTFSVANATVRLTFGEGLTTTFDIKSCFVIFICPNATYKLYFANGKVARAELNAPVAWVAQFLAIGAIAMPGAKIDTKITGIL